MGLEGAAEMTRGKKCEPKAGCEICEQANSCADDEKRRHEEGRLAGRLSQIRYRIMVMSGKGGVGKSTVTTNLAACLAGEGYRVGILDADIHGPNIPRMLGVEPAQLVGTGEGLLPVEALPNLTVISMALLSLNSDEPIVWRGPIKHNLIRKFVGEVQWGELDFLIVDLPPGTGDEPLSVAKVMGSVDGSVVVTTPQDVALLDSRKAVVFSQMMKIPVLGIVENMSGMICPHCSQSIDLFKTGGGEKAAAELNVPFLGRVPIDPEMVEMCDSGKPLVSNRPHSRATEAFQGIAQAVVRSLRAGRPIDHRPVGGMGRVRREA
jgi:ATP-binding protein involved in chromosome partitioning